MNYFDRIHHLPLQLFGYKNIPAYPVEIRTWASTLLHLLERQGETNQAKQGLSNTYTIQGHTTSGYEFLFSNRMEKKQRGQNMELLRGINHNLPAALHMLYEKILKQNNHSVDPDAGDMLNTLSLDEPEQFALSLTTFEGIYQEAEPFLKTWSATLTDVEAANRQFWQMIAMHGLVYNLLIPQKLGVDEVLPFEPETVETETFKTELADGLIYKIDMNIFSTVKPGEVHGFERYTPGTEIFLRQDPETKALSPFAIIVTDYQQQSKTYRYGTSSPGAWLYALQAAKTSITVYGIIMGHVYHWHLVTAAMQMTMKNYLPDAHPVYKLLAPQADYLTGFNNILLLIWSRIAPPTSVCNALSFLDVVDHYAEGRTFFDDDPKTTLQRLGISTADFTRKEAWDSYPIVKTMLTVWDAAETFVTTYIDAAYTDNGVAADEALQQWIAASGDPDEGNIKGLPEVKDKKSLIRILTSIVYRVTMHGASRLRTSDTPAFTFVANFPPCLQSSVLPDPEKPLSTKELLAYLPKTGTIGEMISFIYIFVFSSPYEPFIPLEGLDKNLWFSDEAGNKALIDFRKVIRDVIIKRYGSRPPQIFQWPLNIET